MTRHAGAYHTPAPRPAGQGGTLVAMAGLRPQISVSAGQELCDLLGAAASPPGPTHCARARGRDQWPIGSHIHGMCDCALCATAPQFSLFGRDVLQSRGIVIIYRRRKQLLARNLKTT